jgi:hypothetical protein
MKAATAAGASLPVVAFCLLVLLLPLPTAVQIGADEGFELAKATMFLHGYRSYTGFWNDQPFLHTFLVAQVLKHVSPSIFAARLVTVAFAGLLLFPLFVICERVHGPVVAGLAGLLLLASPGFVELSASCMLEIPALATAVAGLGLLMARGRGGGRLGQSEQNSLWSEPAQRGDRPRSRQRPGVRQPAAAGYRPASHRKAPGGWRSPKPGGGPRGWAGDLLAGAVFGAALQIKYIAAIYLPVAALVIGAREFGRLNGPARIEARGNERGRWTWLKSSGYGLLWRGAMPFALGLIASFALINLAIGGASLLVQFRQSWASHFAGTHSFEYGSPADHPFDWTTLLKNWDVTFPALVGVVVLVRRARQQALALLPLAWLALTLLVFGVHRPWWPYYYVHIAVPLSWCAAVGIVATVGFVREMRSRVWAIVLGLYCLCAGAWMGGRVYLQVRGIRDSPQLDSSLVLKQIARFKPFTKVMYAGDPIYSFHAGIPLPPQIGIIPVKRLWSGDMTNARLGDEMAQIKPGLILLRNDTREVPFQSLLDSDYRLVYEDADHRLYANTTVIRKANW